MQTHEPYLDGRQVRHKLRRKFGIQVEYWPHPVTVSSRGNIKGPIHSDYKYLPTVIEWEQYPGFRV